LEMLSLGSAMEIPLADVGGIGLPNLRSAVHRASNSRGLEIETLADDNNFYVWKKTKSEWFASFKDFGEVHMITTTKWHRAYMAAVLETDWTKMEERILTAESAIRERQYELSLNHGDTPEERQAIADTLDKLKVLRREAASWSDGGSQGLGSQQGTNDTDDGTARLAWFW
jgi:hypothetical protein